MKSIMIAALTAAALLALPHTAMAGRQTFCAQWAYTFDDQGLGEDFLRHNAAQGAMGVIAAFGAEYVVERDGARVMDGHLSSTGCTPSFNAPAGDYKFWITAASIERGQTVFRIFPTNEENKQWFSASWTGLPEQNADRTDTVTLGYGYPTASVAAVASLALSRRNIGLSAGNYTMYAQQDCRGSGFAGCFVGNAVYLGDDDLGNLEAFNKTVVAHELGHFAQNRLFGTLSNYYGFDGDTAYPYCSCNHVTSANQLHCIQSIEQQSAAQVEGFAHFFAANLLNDGSQNDAAPFAYYKEVNTFGGVVPPPSFISASQPYRWHANYCPVPTGERELSDGTTVSEFLGTELDWMTFYYALHNTGGAGAFQFSDLATIYTAACQGQPCAGQTIVIPALSAFVAIELSAEKAEHWTNLISAHGVLL